MREAKNETSKTLMTLPEVQSFLGIKSRKTILKYIKSGELSAYKIGGTRWRIDHSDVLAFMKKQLIEIAEEPTPKSSGAVMP